jgi:hypothetical protein
MQKHWSLSMLSAVTILHYTILTFGFLGTKLDIAGRCGIAASGRVP